MSDWSSDVCSSDLVGDAEQLGIGGDRLAQRHAARDDLAREGSIDRDAIERAAAAASGRHLLLRETQRDACFCGCRAGRNQILFGRHTLVEQTLFATEIALGERQSRSEEHTSELQSLMRISY